MYTTTQELNIGDLVEVKIETYTYTTKIQAVLPRAYVVRIDNSHQGLMLRFDKLTLSCKEYQIVKANGLMV